MITQLTLARHGETEWNRIRQLQGRLDSPLTSDGLQQANQLGQSLLNENVDQIISSSLTRAQSTATICQQHLGCQLSINEQLIERDFGLWQGKKFDQITDQPYFQENFYQVTDHPPPQGESGLACAKRVFQVVTDIAINHPSRHLLIISHGDAIRCFLSLIPNSDSQNALDAYSQHGNACKFQLIYDHNKNKFSRSDRQLDNQQ